MAQKTTTQLKAFNDANINTNGINAITGALHNEMDNDIIDSMVNKNTDSLSIVTNVYRAESVALTSGVNQITFTTPLASSVYEVGIFDNAGIGFDEPFDKQTTGFQVEALSDGNIIYFVILTN